MAMWADAPLVIDGPVDAAAIVESRSAQEVLAGRYLNLRHTTVEASGDAEVPAVEGVACFFSGGVDFFFSAIKQANRITHLIFVLGFDIPIGNADLARVQARKAAAAMGKPLIEVSTNPGARPVLVEQRVCAPWVEVASAYEPGTMATEKWSASACAAAAKAAP